MKSHSRGKERNKKVNEGILSLFLAEERKPVERIMMQRKRRGIINGPRPQSVEMYFNKDILL